MEDRRPVQTVAEALDLLKDPDFHRACDAAHIAHATRRVSTSEILAFFDVWGVAPTRNDGLYRPAYRHEGASILRGRWALVAIRQETTEADICAELRAVQRVIGKRHRDTLERERRADIDAWLRRSGFQHTEIAATLYGRTRDAKRPSMREIKKKRLAQVDRLIKRYRTENKDIPYRLAERRAYATVRGTEGRGALAARAAARRAEEEHRHLNKELDQPVAPNALTAAVIDLLQARYILADVDRAEAALERLRAMLVGPPAPPTV
jgi:hypothetical protein